MIRVLMVGGSVILASFLLFRASFAADAERNLSFESWAKYKPGTIVVQRAVHDTPNGRLETDHTSTLVEVTPEKVVVHLKLTIRFNGETTEPPSESFEIPAVGGQYPGSTPVDSDARVTYRDDTLTIQGRTYQCRVRHLILDKDGVKRDSTSWTSPDMPGLIVKTESTLQGPKNVKTKIEVIKVVLK